MFGFEALQQRRQGERVQKGMDKASMYDRICIKSIH